MRDGNEDLAVITFELPRPLKRRTKVHCAEEGLTISQLLRELLTQKFGTPGKGEGVTA